MRRSKQEFLDWVDEWATRRVAGLTKFSSLLRRTEDWDKKMVEEAIPLHKYVRLVHVDRDIFVELNSERRHGSDGFDAKISTREGAVVEYVQVTGVPAKDEHIDRLILSGGYTFPAGDGGEAVTKRGFDKEDHERQIRIFNDLDGYKASVWERIQRKLRNAYEKPATLAVVLDADMIVEDERRFQEVADYIEGHLQNFGSFSRRLCDGLRHRLGEMVGRQFRRCVACPKAVESTAQQRLFPQRRKSIFTERQRMQLFVHGQSRK